MSNHKNFATSIVVTAPSPATSGTSLVVTTGEGAGFPTTPFFATVHPADQIPTNSNAEIVQVTGISTDTLTIVRAQKSTSAKSIASGWRITNSIYADDDVFTEIGAQVHALTGKTTPVDADEFLGSDSAASNVGKKFTWANIKATLKTYFDTLYQTLANLDTTATLGTSDTKYPSQKAVKSYVDNAADSSKPFFQGWYNSTMSHVSGTWAFLPIDTETTKQGITHSTSTNNNRITIQTAGWYQVSLVWRLATFSASARILSGVSINQTDPSVVSWISQMDTVSGKTPFISWVTQPIYLNAGDYISISLLQDSGSNISSQNLGAIWSKQIACWKIG